MTKEEHILYWINNANDDWLTATALFDSSRYVHSLFFAHLYIEKICKGLWVRDNQSNTPPKTHNLVFLLDNIKVEVSKDELAFLDRLGEFQIESRYPDYQNNLYKRCNQDFTKEILTKVKIIGECLLKNIQ